MGKVIRRVVVVYLSSKPGMAQFVILTLKTWIHPFQSEKKILYVQSFKRGSGTKRVNKCKHRRLLGLRQVAEE